MPDGFFLLPMTSCLALVQVSGNKLFPYQPKKHTVPKAISCCHVTLTSDHQPHKRCLMEIHLGFEDIMMQIPFVNFHPLLAPCCGLQAQPMIHETLHQGKWNWDLVNTNPLPLALVLQQEPGVKQHSTL